jgi:hypothetical protein
VETLDALDLLEPSASDTGLFAESAAALQLAAAAAVADGATAANRTRAARGVFPSRELSRARAAIGVAAFVLATAWALAQLSGSSRAIPIVPEGATAIAAAPSSPDLQTEATMGRIGRPPAPAPEPPRAPATEPSPAPARRAPVVAAPIPLPRVDGVMIAGERRLAIIDGNIVAPGDSIDGRSIVRIERDGVTLRDRSGRETFVPVRTAKREPPGW